MAANRGPEPSHRARRTADGTLRYLRTNFDELAIAGILAKLAFEPGAALTADDEAVMLALKRAVPSLSDATRSEVQEYLAGFDEAQLGGLVNDVKGVLHEMEFVELINADGDTVRAALHPDPANPGYDILMTDEATGEVWELQLKATDSIAYVQGWLDRHPGGEILVTEELADRMDLPTTGFRNDALTVRVEDFVERLQEIDGSDLAEELWARYPLVLAASTGLVLWGLWQQHRRGAITAAEFGRQAAEKAGVKAAKIAVLMALLAVPGVNVVVGTVLTAKLILTADQLFSRSRGRTMTSQRQVAPPEQRLAPPGRGPRGDVWVGF